MAEPKDEKGREPVRVVDRRNFTSEGERRQPDHAPDDAAAAPLPPPERAPAPPPSRRGAAPPSDPVASALFQNLVVNLARQAAANLGASRHPLSGQIEVDLEGAQQMIEILQALRDKTQGNLTSEESELLEGLIGDLQMQYVQVRSKSGGRP
jgi:hypothetical protein